MGMRVVFRGRAKFLSTPSARRATPPESEGTMQAEISIHALREEGDPVFSAYRLRASSFLSTPSARRATSGKFDVCLIFVISIHALREEGDTLSSTPDASSMIFLSTPSARRATLFIRPCSRWR